jgi:hypothetical protein
MLNGLISPRFVYLGFACFVTTGVLLVWIAELFASGANRPFSFWYLAFAAYAVYAVITGIYLRRRFAQDLGRTDLPTSAHSRRWFARQTISMVCALAPITTFAIERIFLRMALEFSVPWYVLGFLLLFLWRPSRRLADADSVGMV